MKLNSVSDRTCFVQRYTVTIIQVYTPTLLRSDDDTEIFHDYGGQILDQSTTKYTLFTGNFNSKADIIRTNGEKCVGRSESQGVVTPSCCMYLHTATTKTTRSTGIIHKADVEEAGK